MNIRKKLLVVSALLFAVHGFSQTIYTQTINNIDGSPVAFSSYHGSKVLLLIAPALQEDSLLVDEIDSFKVYYGDSIKIIGIMSYEDGYADSNKTKIKSMYQSRGLGNMVLTEGMHTRKGAGQSPLFTWLVSDSANLRFKVRVGGVQQKFFISQFGKLYAVLSAPMPLVSAAVEQQVFRKIEN